MSHSLDRRTTFRAVAEQLADDLACAPEDFAADGVTVVPGERRMGRRRFPYSPRSLQVASTGRGAVVCCDPERLHAVRSVLAGVSPDEVFDLPVLGRLAALAAEAGLALSGPFQHAVCWPGALRPAPVPTGLTVELLSGAAIERIYAHPGFDHALEYDPAASRPDVLAAAGYHTGRIVGVAGASADSERLWQIGVDVVAGHRGRGVAAALVSRVAEGVFAAGRVPYYATTIGHLTSARVALRLGFEPAWVAAYTRAGEGEAAP